MSLARLGELERRMSNVIRPGTVVEADYAQARIRVKIGGNTTAWVPWMTSRAGGDRSWHAPEIGEQVLVLAPCGDLAQGYALPSVYQNDSAAPASSEKIHRTEYEDGAIIEYDRENHRLKAVIPGEIIAEAEGMIKATSQESIEAFAETNIVADAKGNITARADGNINATAEGNITATATGSASINAGTQINIAAPIINLTGQVIHTGGDMLSEGISAQHHGHSAVTTGEDVSGPPVP